MSTPLHDLVEDTLASIAPPPSAALGFQIRGRQVEVRCCGAAG